MRKITSHLKKKKKDDSDTRTIKEIMESLDLSTACTILTDKIDRCPDSIGRPMNPRMGLGSKFQEALSSVIPQSERGKARSEASIYRGTHIPMISQWNGWSRNLTSKIDQAAVRIVADHIFSDPEPETLFNSSNKPSGGGASADVLIFITLQRCQEHGPRRNKPMVAGVTEASQSVAHTGYHRARDWADAPTRGQPGDQFDLEGSSYVNDTLAPLILGDICDESGRLILMSGGRGGGTGEYSGSPSSTDSLVFKFDGEEDRSTVMSQLDTLKRHPNPEISYNAETLAGSAAGMDAKELQGAVQAIQDLLEVFDQQEQESQVGSK